MQELACGLDVSVFCPAAVALPRHQSECNERPILSLGVRVSSSRRGSATRHVYLQELACGLHVSVFCPAAVALPRGKSECNERPIYSVSISVFRPAAVALPRGKSECNERPTLSLGVHVSSSRRGSATRQVSVQESALCLYVFVFVQPPWLCHAATSKSESTGVTQRLFSPPAFTCRHLLLSMPWELCSLDLYRPRFSVRWQRPPVADSCMLLY